VDLTARDALWLAYSLLRAADHLVADAPAAPSALDGVAER
jgi:phytoene/squalene synthetase